jgi:thioredoxin 2
MEKTRTGRHVTLACQFCGTPNRVDLDRARDRPKCGQCGRPMLLDRPVPLNDTSFDRAIGDADVPVLVDFYADWCGPCKIMAPRLDELAREHIGELVVGKLDTDRNQATASRFGIRGIPTLILFRGGKEAGRQVGVVEKGRLEEMVRK